MCDQANEIGQRFVALVETMRRLRAPDGCPWDLKQTFQSLKPYLLEETYEVLDAIDREHWPDLAEELGDLMLQPVFLAQLASESGFFTIGDSLAAINAKLIRRHPHIFGDGRAHTAEAVKVKWDEIKRQENVEKKRAAASSILDDVLRTTPALVEASKLSGKAAAAGFDWPEIDGVLEKLQEEAKELAEARESNDAEHVAHELGDMLFTLVNLARFLAVDPEQALRSANVRFRQRFAYVEQSLKQAGSSVGETNLEELEALWQEGKKQMAK